MNNRNYLMNIFIFFVVLLSNVIAQKNSQCTTPNGERATCIHVLSCEPILKILETRNRAAVRYAQNAHCGYDGKAPLVCCGSTVVLDQLDEIFGIFSVLPIKKTPEEEKRDLENLIKRSFEAKMLPDRSVCGIEMKINRTSGSKQAELDEFPWTVLLEYNSKRDGSNAGIRCGGSLINNKYILTGASCVSDKDYELTNVQLGKWNVVSDRNCQGNVACATAVTTKVKKEIPHPFYNRGTGNNNIGLLMLEQDINFTDYIRPICLPHQSSTAPSENSALIVAGWGIKENQINSEFKLKETVQLIGAKKCKESLQIAPYQLCIDGESGKKSSCQGEVGGPLMKAYEDRDNKQKQWYQEGVLGACAASGHRTVYTRVSRYLNWIKRTIAEQ